MPGNRPIETLLETGMDGTLLDPDAIDPAIVDPEAAWLPVTTMGIERDGFRDDTVVANVSMGTEEAGWAGVYMRVIRSVSSRDAESEDGRRSASSRDERETGHGRSRARDD
jgi:hypothetical protein